MSSGSASRMHTKVLTTPVGAPAGVGAVRGWVVFEETGDALSGEPARRVPLRFGGQLSVGRNAGCGLIIGKPTVSKIHCNIEVSKKGQVFVEDLRSVNHTFLLQDDESEEDLEPLEPHKKYQVLDGSTVMVGRERLRFELPKKVLPAAAAADQLPAAASSTGPLLGGGASGLTGVPAASSGAAAASGAAPAPAAGSGSPGEEDGEDGDDVPPPPRRQKKKSGASAGSGSAAPAAVGDSDTDAEPPRPRTPDEQDAQDAGTAPGAPSPPTPSMSAAGRKQSTAGIRAAASGMALGLSASGSVPSMIRGESRAATFPIGAAAPAAPPPVTAAEDDDDATDVDDDCDPPAAQSVNPTAGAVELTPSEAAELRRAVSGAAPASLTRKLSGSVKGGVRMSPSEVEDARRAISTAGGAAPAPPSLSPSLVLKLTPSAAPIRGSPHKLPSDGAAAAAAPVKRRATGSAVSACTTALLAEDEVGLPSAKRGRTGSSGGPDAAAAGDADDGDDGGDGGSTDVEGTPRGSPPAPAPAAAAERSPRKPAGKAARKPAPKRGRKRAPSPIAAAAAAAAPAPADEPEEEKEEEVDAGAAAAAAGSGRKKRARVGATKTASRAVPVADDDDEEEDAASAGGARTPSASATASRRSPAAASVSPGGRKRARGGGAKADPLFKQGWYFMCDMRKTLDANDPTKWRAFDDDAQAALNAAHAKKQKQCTIHCSGVAYVVSLTGMQQWRKDDPGRERPVMLIDALGHSHLRTA